MTLVFCNGMNRAGSTLQYNMVRLLIEKMEIGKGEGFFSEEQLSTMGDQLKLWAQDPSFHVVKTHGQISSMFEKILDQETKICYIYRDIRNVAASFIRMWGFSWGELLIHMDKIVERDHIIKASADGILIQRYENVILNLPDTVNQIVLYLGLERDESVIDEVVKESSPQYSAKIVSRLEFKLLVTEYPRKLWSRCQQILCRMGVLLPVTKADSSSPPKKRKMDQVYLLHPRHVSRNASNVKAWQDILEPQQIEEISTRYRDWLVENGYEI